MPAGRHVAPLLFMLLSPGSPTLNVTFERDNSATWTNVLKGFYNDQSWTDASGWDASIDFAYFPLRDAVVGRGAYDWSTTMDPALALAGARARHLVVRFYLDYPSKATGVPDYLVDAGLGFRNYTDLGGGACPDYENETLVVALEGFVGALGARYDNDARLGGVQAGLLGFWGEWHTWPHSEWFASAATQRRVLDAFARAFNATPVMVRYADAVTAPYAVGFHDDSFAYSTVGASIGWFFASQLASAGATERWRARPIGGELRPELQATIFSDAYAQGAYAQNFSYAARATKASALLNYRAFTPGYAGADLARARDAARLLGYELVARWASAETAYAGGALVANLTVALANEGIAPFYRPLRPRARGGGGGGGGGDTALACVAGCDGGRLALHEALQPGATVLLRGAVELGAQDVDAHRGGLLSSVNITIDCGVCYQARPVALANAEAVGGVLPLPRRLFVSPATSAEPSAAPTTTCNGSTYIYRLDMSDSGGDGWQGAEWCVLDADDYVHDCADTNYGALSTGDYYGCSNSDGGSSGAIPSYCPNYDDDDFSAADMCCVCGGGSTTDTTALVASGKCTTAEAAGLSQADGTLADGSYGVEWMCLEDGCYELLVGGGAADSEIGFKFIDEVGGHFQDLSAPYADHFCVAAGDIFDHPTPSPSVTAVPTQPPTPYPTAAPTTSAPTTSAAPTCQCGCCCSCNSNCCRNYEDDALEHMGEGILFFGLLIVIPLCCFCIARFLCRLEDHGPLRSPPRKAQQDSATASTGGATAMRSTTQGAVV